MPVSPQGRAYVKGLVLSLGMMEVSGNLYPPKVTNAGKEEQFTTVCPTDDVATTVHQFYQCENGHGPFSIGECAKAKEVNGVLTRMTQQEVDDARQSKLPENQLEINVHRRDDVQHRTLNSGTTYVFKPEGSSKLYGILLDFLAKHPDIVLMGQVSLRKVDKLMQISRGLNNQLILSELVWPEDLKEFDAPVYEYKKGLLEVAETMIDKAVTSFDPKEYEKQARLRIAELVASKAGEKPAKKAKKAAPVKSEDDDILAMMQAAIAAK